MNREPTSHLCYQASAAWALTVCIFWAILFFPTFPVLAKAPSEKTHWEPRCCTGEAVATPSGDLTIKVNDSAIRVAEASIRRSWKDDFWKAADLKDYLQAGTKFSLQCSDRIFRAFFDDVPDLPSKEQRRREFGLWYKQAVRDEWLVRLSYDGEENLSLEARNGRKSEWIVDWGGGSVGSFTDEIRIFRNNTADEITLRMETDYSGDLPLFSLNHSAETELSMYGAGATISESFFCMRTSDLKEQE